MASLNSWADLDSQAYEYTLMPPEHEIRCLTLEPGNGEEPIYCTLASRKIKDSLPFEAISYVWGNAAVLNYEINCEGKILLITPNLAMALRQCRLPDRKRVLWADSVCINQNDNTGEKENQVRQMGKIYSEAEGVLMCMGPDPNGCADSLRSLFEEINLMLDGIMPQISSDWNSFPAADVDNPLVHDERWKAFHVLLDHAWFWRGWVVQEASVAKKAHFLWGDTRIEWLQLMRAYTWGWRRAGYRINVWIPDAHTNIYIGRYKEEAKTFTPPMGLDRQDLLLTLQACRHLGVKDERDRVYAFLGLPEASFITETGGFSISYSKNFLDVYRDFACCYLQHAPKDPLRILQHSYFYEDIEQPSWVPIWNRRWSVNKVEVLCTGAEVIYPPQPRQTCHQIKLNDDALTCRGLVLDVVAEASQAFAWDPKDNRIEEVVSEWQKLGPFRHSNLVYDFPLLAFINLIRCGRQPPSFSAEHMSTQIRAWMALLDNSCDGESGNERLDDREQHGCLHRVGNRRIAVTECGYFCLLPASAREGDLCCIIYGTELPFILRRMEREGTYRLIGVSYIVSSRYKDFAFGRDYLRIGKGQLAHEEWLDRNLQDEQITIV